MRNGVEVIVATERRPRPAETEYLRQLSSTVTRPITLAPHTLTNLMSMVLPTDSADDGQDLVALLQPSFVTRTLYTTYDFPTTLSKDNLTSVSRTRTTITNLHTHHPPDTPPPPHIHPTAPLPVTLTASPTLHTHVLPTTFTYWNTFLDGEQPIVMSSTHTLSNTLVGALPTPALEPSEALPSTNTYLRTIGLTRTITDGTDFHVVSTSDLLTQVVVTDSLPRPPSLPVTTDVTKTYFVTYTYFSTYLDGDQTKVKSDVSVSSDVTIEKFYIKPKKTETKLIQQTREPPAVADVPAAAYPFRVFATRTYFTTFTYYTTLFATPSGAPPETKLDSRTTVLENVVTETIPLQDLSSEYLLRLNSSLSRITGLFVTTATLKGGEAVRVTAERNAALSSSYLHYEIKPTKTLLSAETSTELLEKTSDISKPKTSFSKSILLSKTKTTPPQKSKIKPTKTLLREATAEALVATTPDAPPPPPTVTFTPATLTLPPPSPPTPSPPPHHPTPLQPPSPSSKPPPKPPVNVTNLLNLNSLGINGINVLGPVFNAMAELIHNNLNKNADALSRRNDTAPPPTDPEQPPNKPPPTANVNPLLSFVSKFTPAASKPTPEPKLKPTTPRAPVYIPVGSFASDSHFGESQLSEVALGRPHNWHDKWTDAHAKNFDKPRPHDPPITILEGGIPISPGQVITTNSDVIIGRPGDTAPRPPTFAISNNIPLDMKPPPPPPPHPPFAPPDDDALLAQHSTHHGVDLTHDGRPPPRPRPPLPPPKPSPYDSGAIDLNPPPVPPPPVRSHDVHHPITINHHPEDPDPPQHPPQHPPHIPLHLTPTLDNHLSPADLSLPPLHHPPPPLLLIPTLPLNPLATDSPPLLDRSTAQQLLVNIRPSQVANIVIPHGSSTALILSDGKHHSLKGEVIDDPSPHPEPETVGFVGAEPVLKIESEDIGASFHNDVVPAAAGEGAQHSHRVVLSARPHLTTELIKIRPKPALEAPKEDTEQLFFAQQQSGGRPQGQGNHRPEGDGIEGEGHRGGSGVFGVQVSGEGTREAEVSQNYRKEGSGAGGGYLVQGQQKIHSYVSGGGLYAEQSKYVQRPGAIRGGNGIYVDISPPGHLPPRPNANVLHQTHSSEKQQQAAVVEHLLNHQSGLVHDVPLNAQVQLGSGGKKENPLKEILIGANTNKHDSIYDPNKPTDSKYLEGQSHLSRPLPDLPDNLSPPPLSKDPYRPHRPSPFIPPHPLAPHRHPPHPSAPKPPPDFMLPPPQPPHRPTPRPPPDHHPRPIPIGAGAPHQNYPQPRPEDILIVPHKNRPPLSYLSTVTQHIQQTLPSDLDVSDSSDPIKTEYGEEIQESISRPLFPGQLPPELQKLNASHSGSIHNHNIAVTEPDVGESSKPDATSTPAPALTKPDSSADQQKKPPTAFTSNSQPPFFSLIKKPSGFVTPNQKESALANHNLESSTPVKAPAKGGSIRIHAVGPSVLPSGFVKNENAVDNKRPPVEPQPTASVQSNFIATNSKKKPNLQKKEPEGGEVSSGGSAKDETTRPDVPTKDNRPPASGNQDKAPGRRVPTRGYHKPDGSKQKLGGSGGQQTAVELQEAQSGPIQFDSGKVVVGYPTGGQKGAQKGTQKVGQRYPEVPHTVKPSKRPSGFTSSKKEEKGSFASAAVDVPKQPPLNPQPHPNPPSGFTLKNESQHPFHPPTNHKYPNATPHFYESKPTYDLNDERDVLYNTQHDKWPSPFGHPDPNPPAKPPLPHPNSSAPPTKPLPPDPDLHITLLPPPRTPDGRPKPDHVMGLSPPPLERPRRPQRPKPPFNFDIPTTPKPTLPPIAIENDFPPVRSPDFNRKPLKPQDIFPPRLPDNFHHPLRNHPPPPTSLPIDTPTDTPPRPPHDSLFAASDINGHSKPITPDPDLTPLRPPPPPPPQPPSPATPDRPHTPPVSPTPTTPPPPATTFHTKLTTSVTPTAEHPHSHWRYPDIITASETLFDPDRFPPHHTPTIRDFTPTKNILTTLVTTGSTTIFPHHHTPNPPQPKPPFTHSLPPLSPLSPNTPTPTPSIHTTTLTVTTTMTTVVHSLGHKPSTKTILLTKTLISTVFDKVTETTTLLKPTTATVTQTHTVATTKTALVVPTALHPPPTTRPPGTLTPEIFLADPHAKDTITISVSSSMSKGRHGEEKKGPVYVVEDGEGEGRVVVGGVFEGGEEGGQGVECRPGCEGGRNELCQRVEGVMKCVCRAGFARMFPDRPCRPTYTFNVQLMLERQGGQERGGEGPNMAQLASATKEGLERMIMQSELRDIYHGVMVNGFQGKEKKTMVDFYVQLSENTEEGKLTEILRKTLQTSNYSLGGTELFAARESGSLSAEDFNECLSTKFHDCSENARCFNLKGTYTCSCKEGYTDLSENSQFPGRVCSDTIGCEYCGYHGACYSKGEGQITCECFQWYSGERCHINLKVLLIALVTIGAVLLALLLVCGVLTCLNRRSRGSSRTNGSSAGYLRYRGPSTQSLDRRAMIADSSSESSIDNLPYVCAPPAPPDAAPKKKPALRHSKGPAPRPLPPPAMDQRDRSVTVMIPRAKYRPMPPLSPHLTMSTFSPDKHLSKTAAQIATEQKLLSYLDGSAREREERSAGATTQNGRAAKEQQKGAEFKAPSPGGGGSPKAEQKKESKVFEYEYKMSNMVFTEETNSADKRSFKSLDDRFRRHSDSAHLGSDCQRSHFRKYSAGALVSAGYEVSAKVGMHHLEDDTTEDEHSAVGHTLKSARSQFATLNRTGDHKTMSEARSYDETTVHPPTRSLKTHYSGSSPSSRVNNDEGHTMIERDLGSTFILPESQLFKPEADRGSDISNFDSL